jgi:DNA-binding transcriptional regulator YbjK
VKADGGNRERVKKIDPPRARREEEKEERRPAMLDVTEKVIARDGWEATNSGEIAKRARLIPTSLNF